MKRITLTLAAFAYASAVFGSTTGSESNERSLREACGASSQAAMKDCLAKKADESQKELDKAEILVTSKLAQWDEDARYINRAKTSEIAAAQSFVQFRKAQCDFVASLSGGAAGNAGEARRLACIASLNADRAAALRSAVSELPER
jgi:hypothetical protein